MKVIIIHAPLYHASKIGSQNNDNHKEQEIVSPNRTHTFNTFQWHPSKFTNTLHSSPWQGESVIFGGEPLLFGGEPLLFFLRLHMMLGVGVSRITLSIGLSTAGVGVGLMIGVVDGNGITIEVVG